MTNLRPTIAVRKLCCHFGKKVAVDNLELDVYSGEVFGILGHNGAGKTTIVRLLNGLLLPSAGQINVMGLNPTTEGAVLRLHTGVLTETPALEELLTARDNLCIYARLYNISRSEITDKIEKLLQMFNLIDHADQKVRGYSNGALLWLGSHIFRRHVMMARL